MAKADGMKNLESCKLYLRVYDKIKSYIEKNHLIPGDKLSSEVKMYEMLEVSRNVLREIIKSLEITGTVCFAPGVGIVIQELSTDLFPSNLIYSIGGEDQLHKKIGELCRVLELGFTEDTYESITPESPESLIKEAKTMESLFVQIKQSRSSVYGARFAEVDASLYKILLQAVDNHLLGSIIGFFWACDRYYKVKTTHGNMEFTVEKHLRIYNATKTWDHQKYYDAMQFHFNVGCFKRWIGGYSWII